MTQSSGYPELDSLSLDYARHWTFKPATFGGKPMESSRPFEVDFDVSS
jgi:outer membrane biosynthesis protein TonB